MSSRPLNKTLVAFLSIALAVMVFVGYMMWSLDARHHRVDLPPGEIFEALFSRPLPEVVEDLQTAGRHWQGYSIYLRFRAPSLAAAGVTSPPYQPVDCSEIRFQFIIPPTIHSTFSPFWYPPGAGDGVCFRARDIENDWTKLGSHFVMKSGEWVHFSGFGP